MSAHEQKETYTADSMKAALGIGKRLSDGHSRKSLHCAVCPNAQLPKQPFPN